MVDISVAMKLNKTYFARGHSILKISSGLSMLSISTLPLGEHSHVELFTIACISFPEHLTS